MFQVIYICFLFIFGFNLCQCFDEAWYHYQSSLRNENREELVVTNVTADENVVLKSKVQQWKSISVGSTCYTVGILDTNLTVLFTTFNSSRSGFDVFSNTTDIKRRATDVILIHNRRNGSSEIILVASFLDAPELIWYKIQNNTLKEFWSWTMQKSITHINNFKVSDKDILLLVYSENTLARLDIYEFDIKSDILQPWLIQSIILTDATNSTAFNELEDYGFLSIPQHSQNLVLVYKFEDNKFIHYKTIKSFQVATVVSFDIISKTFIAVDGYDAGIYEFVRDDIVEHKVVNGNLYNIHYWLPIPVRTLRDEVILLAQRKLDHATHETCVVEVITFNGVRFEEHEDIPCIHYEEKVEWLTCLSIDNGIVGSGYVVVGNHYGLIVPRYSTSFSILFSINLYIKQLTNPKKNDIEQLENIRHALQGRLEHISNLNNPANQRSIPPNKYRIASDNILKNTEDNNITDYTEIVDEIGRKIQALEEKFKVIKKKENRTEFDTITLNGPVEILGDASFRKVEIKEIDGIPANELLEDIVRKDDIHQPLGNKTFTDLEVEDLYFDTINGIDKDNIFYQNESTIVINGNVTFTKPLKLGQVQISDNKINDIDLENEIVQIKNKYNGSLEFDNVEAIDYQTKVLNDLEVNSDDMQNNDKHFLNIEMDSIIIPENVTVNYINGKNFTEFIHSLCLVNVKCHVPGTVQINGNVTVANASVETLNGLQFPGEYITKGTSSHANITGEKRFKNSLTAQEIRMRGTVDGLDTKNIITLSTNQAIPGTISFDNLELTEELNVTGRILGENLDKFLPNPTLELMNVIKSNVNFNSLEVEGNIILEETFNNQHLETLLNDVIYNDDHNTTITANKDFKQGLTIVRNLEVESKSINNIKLDDIVTKNTDQELEINLLNGNVNIDNLFLGGLYDDMNITEIDESLVKLTGEQFISSTFIFSDEIVVEKLEVEILNDLTSEQYLYYVGDRVIKKEIAFEDIAVENLFVEKDFNGNIVNFDVDDINNRYLSYTKNQSIDADFTIRLSNIDKLEIKDMNYKPDRGIINSQYFSRIIREKLENGTLEVGNLHVSKSINVDTINDKSVASILPRDPLEFLQSNGAEDIVITGDVYFDDIDINFLSNVNWTQLTNELVFKNETNIRLKGPILFNDTITVEKLIETDRINNVLLNNILTKVGHQEIKGPVNIHGNASFENITITEDINTVPVALVLDRIKVDNGIYTIKDDMVFKRLSHIYELNVNGTINQKQFEEILSNMVYLDTDNVMEGDMIFEKPVNISGNLAIMDFLDNVNISVVTKIVLTTNDAEIQGAVHFQRSVTMKEKINVNELDTRLLFGFDTNDWVSRAIFLNSGLLKGNYNFKDIVINEELSTNFLNDIDMSLIIPLKSNQTLEYLEFDRVNVVNDIKVGNMVNNRKLPEEFERTVMRDLDQEILSDILFQNHIVVRQNLTTHFINNNAVSNMVTTNTNQNLTGTYNFISKAIVESHIVIHGTVNNINLTTWADNSVKIFSPEVSDVVRDWNVSDVIDFRDDVMGDFMIDDMDIKKLAKEIDERRREKYEIQYKTIKDYQGMCKDLRYMREKAKHQLFKFKYFEDLQLISYPNNIQHTFYFSQDNKHYLIVNEENCLTHMLVFNDNKFYPLKEKIDTGHISQIVLVREGGILYLVSRGNQNAGNCSITGTNIWEITNSTLELRFNIQDQILLQESNVPATFYGLSEEGVIEFKINSKLGCSKYRRWEYIHDNAMFVPRGFQTGLALRTGENIVFLERSNTLVQQVELDTESILRGDLRAVPNHFMPGKNGGNVLVTNVGIRSANRNLLAVTENVTRGSFDLIKIYSNPLTGELFQQIPAHRPSSLVSLEYGQAETMLVFMENKKILQVYEYKGIEGFKYLASTKMPGSELFGMTLPIKPYLNSRKCIGVVNSNKIRIIQSVMTGNRLEENINCDLF